MRRTRLRAIAIAALLTAGAAPAAAQSSGDLAALIDDLVAANRILYTQGVVDGFGHVSVRHPNRPDRFLMCRAIPPGRLTREALPQLYADAVPVNPRAP